MIRTFAPSAPERKPARRDKPQMTLDRVLSRTGVASRTAARDIIAAGRVTLEGRVLRDPDAWMEPAREAILLDGKRLRLPPPLYLALHKPVGVLTSHGDPQGRRTIYDVVGPRSSWYFPVGRLDQDTSGLLLLTNDSVFAERIASPEGKIAKTYRVKVQPPLSPTQMERLCSGMDIGRGEHTAPAKANWLRGNQKFCWIELEIKEGKNRQVRRMIEALGHEVTQLVRVRIGKLALGTLAPGAVRAIRPGEVV